MQLFIPAAVREVPATGPHPAPSSALVGKHVLWRFGAGHQYEHVHLSPTWLTWQGLGGPETGLADTDEHVCWELRTGIYAVAWRKKSVAAAAVMVQDHRDPERPTATGTYFGLAADGTTPIHATFGASGRLLPAIEYPVSM